MYFCYNTNNMAIEKDTPAGGVPVLRFEDVSFGYSETRFILKEANFVVRKGLKLTLMGQNGAGKSTLFSLIMGENQVTEGRIIEENGEKVAISKQTIPHSLWEMTVRDFLLINLEKADKDGKINKAYDIDKRAVNVFEIVKLPISFLDKQVKELSGGQKGRLLIAEALIQNPDILLLDEPTNNLDKDGVKLLTEFMKNYAGTVIVISHDENFLNTFTHGILYVNVQNQKVEQYVGNYFKAVDEIKKRVERELRANELLEREIQDKKDKVNFFAHKGGKMRALAAKLKEEYEEAEEEKVEVRKDDRTIKSFTIPVQEEIGSVLISISSVEILIEGGRVNKKISKQELMKRDKLQIIGPNGIGKTTLLEKIAKGKVEGVEVKEGIKIGYYRQDFSTLDFSVTALDALSLAYDGKDIEKIRKTASTFLLSGKELATKVGDLSEGQKGLLMFAYLTLLKPGILILDEPTNHINFRHIPIIQEALKNFEGAMIIISHVNNFIRGVGVNKTIDLGKL
jgi:ATP-binding cassette, subfamily F, member 3